MRVFYDGQNYFPPQGVGRYFKNIIERLPEDFAPSMAVTNLQLDELPQNPRLERLVGWTAPSLRAYLRFAPLRGVAAHQLRRKARGLHYDIAHPTWYELLSGRSVTDLRGPVVVTVHDMIHEIFPELDPSGKFAATKRAAADRADIVVCVSANTRKDLLERTNIAEDRVVITHNATNLSAAMTNGNEVVPAAPYLIFVGGRAPYKNFDMVLDAFARSGTVGLHLVVVGHRFTAIERAKIQDLGIGDLVIHVGRVSDPHLAKLYRHSVALLYPSLYEGFGIPPLEAMACGTAVITANTSSLPDVVGDAAILVDPRNVDELVDGIRLVHGSPARRQELIEAGYRRASAFDWARTAQATADLYRQLV